MYLTLPHLNSSTGKSRKKLIATEVALQLLEVLTIKYYGMEGGWVSGYHLKREQLASSRIFYFKLFFERYGNNLKQKSKT